MEERVRRAAASREMQGADGLADRDRLGTARNRRHAKQKANRRTTSFFSAILARKQPCFGRIRILSIMEYALALVVASSGSRDQGKCAPSRTKGVKKLPIALFDDAQNAILTRTDSKPCTGPHGEANRSQSKGPYGESQAWRAGTGSNLYAYGINSV